MGKKNAEDELESDHSHATVEKLWIQPGDEALADVSPQLAHSRRATQAAWRRLEAEFGLLSISEVAEILLGAHQDQGDVQPATEGLLGVRLDETVLYPGFQFDRESNTALPVVTSLLALAAHNDWTNESLALWIVSPSESFSGDGRPVDHLSTDPEAVLSAARNTFELQW